MRNLFLGLICLSATAAQAALVTYEYRGADYDFIVDRDFDPTVTRNPWDDRTQDFISGYLTFDTDYLPGGSLSNASFSVSAPGFAAGCGIPGCSNTAIHDYEFFDGVFTHGVVAGNHEFLAFQDFSFTTDAYGNIAEWNLDLLGDPSELVISSRRGDARLLSTCGDGEDRRDHYVCVRSSGIGSWRKVDEPGTLGLALGALVLVPLLWNRRRRHS